MTDELDSFDPVDANQVNEVIRKVNALGNLKVYPPLEITKSAGNPQLRLVKTGFQAVVTKITPINISPSSFSSGLTPAPSNGIIYYYDVEELQQQTEGEWTLLRGGRILQYVDNYGVFEWNNNIVPVGTVVYVEQTSNLYQWTFFAPGGTVCTQLGYFLANTPIINNQIASWQSLATWDLPAAGTWLVCITGGVELSVTDPSAEMSNTPGESFGSGGTVYLQVINETLSVGVGNALYGSYISPVTAVSYGTTGYASGTIGMKLYITTQIPCTLRLQGYVLLDNPCPPTTPPCATFSCNFSDPGVQIQWAWIGPSCVASNAGYTPGFLTGCSCVLVPTAYEYDTLAACLEYLNQSLTGCGGSLSSSSSPSCMLSSSSPSSSSSGCLCPTSRTVTVNLISTGVNCNLTGSYTCIQNDGGQWEYNWNTFEFPFVQNILFTCNDDSTGTITIEVMCNIGTVVTIVIDVTGSLCPLDMGGIYQYNTGETGCCWGCWSATVTA